MFILLAFFVSATGVVSTTTVEFHSAEACESAKSQVIPSVPVPNKIAVCVPK